ncbi:hypothetical protein SGCOL_008445 [Colletotrichum sp. CLE4]
MSLSLDPVGASLIEFSSGPGELQVHEPDSGTASRDVPSIARILCIAAVRELKGVVRLAELRDDLSRSNRHCLKKACDTLTLWASGYGIPEGDLDEALATSWILQRSVLELLVSIGNLLLNKLIPLLNPGAEVDTGPFALNKAIFDASWVLSEGLQRHRRTEISSGDESDSSSDSTVSEDHELESALQDIDISVQCLLDLGPLINGHVRDYKIIEVRHSGDAVTSFKPHQIFTNILSYRYPEAPKDLLDRLARANLERFLRTHNLRTENADDAKFAENGPGPSEFSDSGVGMSTHTDTSYAATLMSYRQKSSHSVKIPPLSETAKQG